MTYVPYARRSFSGSAPDTTLTGNVDNSTLTVAITDGTGWPDGSGGNFVVIFEPGTTSEEKALASSRSGNTLTLAQRALEGSAVSHTASSVIRHGLSALDVNEANYAVSQTVALVAAKGDVLYGTAANTLGKLAKGSANQSPMWDSSGALVAGNPTPGAHTHAETDVTSLVSDLGALQSQQATNTSAIAANTSAITALQGATGGPLAVVAYSPTPATAINLTGSGGAPSGLTSLDSTHLKVTFTAPASGQVLVKFNGIAGATAGVRWGVVNGSGSTLASAELSVSAYTFRYSLSLLITGLSGSQTFYWGGSTYFSGGYTILEMGQNSSALDTSNYGPAVMEVWAA